MRKQDIHITLGIFGFWYMAMAFLKWDFYPEDGTVLIVPIKTAKLIKMAVDFLEVEVDEEEEKIQ